MCIQGLGEAPSMQYMCRFNPQVYLPMSTITGRYHCAHVYCVHGCGATQSGSTQSAQLSCVPSLPTSSSTDAGTLHADSGCQSYPEILMSVLLFHATK